MRSPSCRRVAAQCGLLLVKAHARGPRTPSKRDHRQRHPVPAQQSRPTNRRRPRPNSRKTRNPNEPAPSPFIPTASGGGFDSVGAMPRRSPQTGSCLCPPPRGFRTTRTSTILAAAMDTPPAVFSRRNPPQGLPRTGQADAEPPRRGAEIPAVERRQGVGAAICRGFKDHFATGVARHRPPRKAGGNRPGRGTRGGNDHLDPVPAQPGSHSPPWAPAHRPALEGQGCGKGPKQTAFPAPFQAVWRMPRTGRGTPQPQHWCPVPAA